MCEETPAAPPAGLSLHLGSSWWGGLEVGAHWLPRPPGTDPEEAILSAFRMFDPDGKGVVNKDE